MKLTVFASGSGGNCSLVRSGGACVLIDAGISAKRIREGLARAGLLPGDLNGIFITHEHADHISGLSVLLKKTPVPLYAPGTVADALKRSVPGADAFLHVLEAERPLTLEGLTVTPFPTPHDTVQSVGYRMEADDGCFAYATDTGCVTETMLRWLAGADLAFIEANHDEAMLRSGPYPPYLQARILSDRGHLSNAECTFLTSVLARSGVRQIVLGHLSRENNRPELALSTVSRGLEGTQARVCVAPVLGFLEVDCSPCCE